MSWFVQMVDNILLAPLHSKKLSLKTRNITPTNGINGLNMIETLASYEATRIIQPKPKGWFS